METSSQFPVGNDLIYIEKSEYNAYGHARIIFFHKNKKENIYHFLLHKAHISSKYSDLYSDFISQDSSSIFCGTRIILEKLHGSLSNTIFRKLNNNEDLTSADILSEVTIYLEFLLMAIRNLIGLSYGNIHYSMNGWINLLMTTLSNMMK